MLGIKIAAGIIEHGDGADEREYNRAFDAWLAQTLKRLQAVSKPQAKLAMLALDGGWWDSSKPLPEWRIVLRRNTRIGTTIRPWLVSDAFPPGKGPDVGCGKAGPALPLHNPDGFEGVRFSQVATLRIDVDAELVKQGLPLRTAEPQVTQAEFPRIIERIRREMTRDLGANVARTRITPG